MSSNNLDKYEDLTCEDLSLKPSTIKQAKFELGKIFNKGFDEEEDKKEGLLKRLSNIEDKNEQQLETTKSKIENIKQVTNFIKEPFSLEAKALI